MSDLVTITSKLGSDYKRFKSAEKDKDKARKEFFEAAKEEVAKETLAQKTVTIAASDEPTARKLLKQRNPRWTVAGLSPVDVDGKDEPQWTAVLEEDPEYKPFVFVNPEDGQVYQRSVSSGSPTLDDEALKEDDPDFWDEITIEVRELKPMDELTPEQLAKLAPYMYEGKPSIKLPAPRKAKPEELEDNDE